MFLSLAFLGFLILILRPGHISFTDCKDQECFFGSGFRVRACFLGSGFGDKMVISLAQVPDLGCVSFPGSGLQAHSATFLLCDWLVSQVSWPGAEMALSEFL